MFKRLDRVIAIESTRYLTKGKVYTVLGVRGKGGALLIATDLKKKVYLSADLFVSEEEQNKEIINRLENRGF
jgi:hypothetical protein